MMKIGIADTPRIGARQGRRNCEAGLMGTGWSGSGPLRCCGSLCRKHSRLKVRLVRFVRVLAEESRKRTGVVCWFAIGAGIKIEAAQGLGEPIGIGEKPLG